MQRAVKPPKAVNHNGIRCPQVSQWRPSKALIARCNSAPPVTDQPAPFQQLDFLYMSSRDVAADLEYFTEVLGGRMVFAVEAMGTRVAAIQLTEGPPLVLLADHVEGDRPILVYRVADLGAALIELEAHGWQRQHTLEIPQGPCCSLRTPGGHRIALYQLTRPEVVAHFDGRRDF
jgi:hypothetical protein